MRIINIDAPKKHAELFVSKRIPTYVRSFLEPQERKYYREFQNYQDISTRCAASPIRKFECGWYENIAVLWHTIPIYLCAKCPDHLRRMYKDQYNEQHECTIDLLGAYFPIRTDDGPYIELYLEDIFTEAEDYVETNYPNEYEPVKQQKKEEYFKHLVTIVLLHELAHAALDIFNLVDAPSSEEVFYDTDFGKWREESMANAVALRIIRDYGRPTLINYAKKFMELQPAAYKLGVLMEEFGYWDFRSVFYAKIIGVHKDLQNEWLNYAKGTPNWAGLQKWNVLLNRQYVYLFEGKYYTEEELVNDIVNKTLSDYESENGSKMSYSTFTSIFPKISIGAVMSYEPTDTVVEDSRYQNKIQLDDGNYSLYNVWDNVSLHKFIDTEKLGVDFEEYKNY